jgi:hypothetical protein
MFDLSVTAASSSPLQMWILRSQKEILALQASTKVAGSSEALERRHERPSQPLD